MNPLEAYKKLPRTNCGKCSAGTCMSFAVQVLRGMISSSECPELDKESKKEIDAMLSNAGDWKEKRIEALFRDISKIDFSIIAKGIGATVEKDKLKVLYMGKKVSVSHSNFDQKLNIWDMLLVLMYIKQAGKHSLSGKWVAFRDLKDGIIRSESFHGACEVSLARMYEKNKEYFINKLNAIGAVTVSGFSSEHSYVIHPLPKVPLLILLWTGDEEFGAECKVLLDATATDFLDVEALLYLGMELVRAVRS
jgi:hypothetical protein